MLQCCPNDADDDNDDNDNIVIVTVIIIIITLKKSLNKLNLVQSAINFYR